MVMGQLNIHIQKKEVGSLSHTISPNYSKCTIDLHVTGKTTKFLEENIRVNLHDLGFGNRFSI